MQKLFTEFLMTMLTMIFVENVLFSRAFGTSKLFHQMRDAKSSLWFGLAVTFFTTTSATISYFVNEFVKPDALPIYLRGTFFIFIISIIYCMSVVAIRRYFSSYYRQLRPYIIMAAFNSAVYGVVGLASMQQFRLHQYIAYALGSGLGFMLAMLFVHLGKQRLLMCKLPRSFKGLPITLIYIGILSLAIYGLIGHQIPT